MFICTNGGENEKGSQKTPFLAINVKGGENISPNKKDRTTTNFKVFKRSFQLVSNLFHIGKTLLNTKRIISSRGSFV
jgi:hypothetical protein